MKKNVGSVALASMKKKYLATAVMGVVLCCATACGNGGRSHTTVSQQEAEINAVTEESEEELIAESEMESETEPETEELHDTVIDARTKNVPLEDLIDRDKVVSFARSYVAPKEGTITKSISGVNDMGDEVVLWADGTDLKCYSTAREIELGIDEGYFKNCINLQKVDLTGFSEKSNIGKYAFYGCEKLSDLNLGDIQWIHDYTFANCVSITDINFDKVIGIGTCAFRGCNGLTDIDITNVSSLYYGAFIDCENLNCVTMTTKTLNDTDIITCAREVNVVDLPEDHVIYAFEDVKLVFEDGVLYRTTNDSRETGKDDGLFYPVAIGACTKRSNGTFEIPEGIIWVSTGAFAQWTDVDTLIIPASLKIMSALDLKNIKHVEVNPDNPYFCSNDGLLILDSNLMHCDRDKSGEVIIPWGEQLKVSNISPFAFHNCNMITSVDVGEVQISKVPEEYTEFDKNYYPFIYISTRTINNIRDIDGAEYDVGFQCEYVDDGICNYAFSDCENLQTISLNAYLRKDFGTRAFYNCPSLENVTIGGTLYPYSFENCPKLKIVEGNVYVHGSTDRRSIPFKDCAVEGMELIYDDSNIWEFNKDYLSESEKHDISQYQWWEKNWNKIFQYCGPSKLGQRLQDGSVWYYQEN
jgi:hypothetical protein